MAEATSRLWNNTRKEVRSCLGDLATRYPILEQPLHETFIIDGLEVKVSHIEEENAVEVAARGRVEWLVVLNEENQWEVFENVQGAPPNFFPNMKEAIDFAIEGIMQKHKKLKALSDSAKAKTAT